MVEMFLPKLINVILLSEDETDYDWINGLLNNADENFAGSDQFEVVWAKNPLELKAKIKERQNHVCLIKNGLCTKEQLSDLEEMLGRRFAMPIVVLCENESLPETRSALSDLGIMLRIKKQNLTRGLLQYSLMSAISLRRNSGVLVQSNIHLHQILNGLFDGVMILDKKGVIVDVNQHILDQYQLEWGGIIGHYCYEITHHRSSPCFEMGNSCPCPLVEVLRDGQPHETTHIHKDSLGSEVLVEIHCLPLLDTHGDIVNIAEVTRDVTESKKREHALKLYNAELEALYRTSLEIHTQFNLDILLRTIVTRALETLKVRMGGLFVYRSDKDLLELVININMPDRLTGGLINPGDGVAGRAFQTGEPMWNEDYQNWTGKASAFAEENFRRVLGVPLKIGIEVIGVLDIIDDQKTGTFAEEEIRLVRLFADQAAIAVDNVRRFEVAQKEIGFRKLAELALQESKDFIHSTIDALSSHIFVLDADGNVLAVNKAGRDIGEIVPPVTLLNVREASNYLTVCDSTSGKEAEIASAFAEGIRLVISGKQEEFTYEYPSHSTEGKRWFVGKVTRFRANNGPVRVVVSHENITKSKIAEEALAERMRFETFLSDLSAMFISLRANQIDEAVSRGLERIVKFLGFDNSYLFQFFEDKAHLRLTHNYGVEDAQLKGFELSEGRFDWLIQKMLAGEILVYTQGKEIPPEAIHEKKYILTTGIKSGVAIPLRVGDSILGMVGFLSLSSELNWPEDLIQRMKLLGEIFANALVRKHSEDALTESEHRFRDVVEQANEGIALTDEQGHMIGWNQALEKITHISSRDVLGRFSWEVQFQLLPESQKTDRKYEAFKTGFLDYLATGQSTQMDHPTGVEIQRPDGTQIFVEGRTSAIRTKKGFMLVGIFQDITERMLAEANRRENERYLTLLNEITRTTIQPNDLTAMLTILAEQMGNIINADNCCLVLWDESKQGWGPVIKSSSCDSKTVQLLTDKERLAFAKTVLDAGHYLTKDGSGGQSTISTGNRQQDRIKSILGLPLTFGEKRLGVILLGFARQHQFTSNEITRCEQATAQVALAINKAELLDETQRRAEELEILVRVSKAMRIALTRDDIFSVLLDQLSELFGTKAVAIGSYYSAEETITVELGQGEWSDLTGYRLTSKKGISGQVIKTGQFHSTGKLKSSDPIVKRAKSIQGDHTACIPLISQNHMLGLLWLAKQSMFSEKQQRLLNAIADMTASALQRQTFYENLQVQLQALKDAQARLVQSEKMAAMGDLISGVAHELNNPLTSVVLYSQMLQKHDLDEKVKRDIGKILAESQRAARIVRSLLDFARQRPAERVPVQINDLLQSSLDFVSFQLRTNNVRTVLDLANTMPITLADPHQMQQVFVNLLNNAAQEMSKDHRQGILAIHTEVGPSRHNASKEPGKEFIRLIFKDSGPGILQENLLRIFDPFFTTKPEGQGTGLGLAICHSIVTDHQGYIWAESETGTGATFVIEIPVISTEKPAAETGKTKFPPRNSDGKYQVLIIDDEENVLEVLTRILQARGYYVDSSNNAVAGLQLLSTKQYDIILCDIRMPGMNGPDLYHKVKTVYKEMARRIVFITGDTVNPSIRQFIEKENLLCLSKPFELDDLLQVITLLGEKNQSGN